jgi:hypothetical protein
MRAIPVRYRLGIVLVLFATVTALVSLSLRQSTDVTAETAVQSSPDHDSLVDTWPSPAMPLESTALDSQDIQLVGHVGGQIRAVALRGQYAYVGVGPRLVILDVSTRATMTRVGKPASCPIL